MTQAPPRIKTLLSPPSACCRRETTPALRSQSSIASCAVTAPVVFTGTPTHPKAKKEHRCIYCGGPILVGEQYVQQEGFYDGAPYRNRYHAECYETCAEECSYYGEWEFSPYNGEYPERVKAVVDVRQAAADAVLLGA